MIVTTLARQNGDSESDVKSPSVEAKTILVTPGQRVRVEWSAMGKEQVSQMGGLAYFGQFLKATGFFDQWVEDCPLTYESNNAPAKRDILGTTFLSVLNGHNRYAHMTALRGDELSAQLLDLIEIPSEDSVRRGLLKITKDHPDSSWMEKSFEVFDKGLLEEPWVMDLDVTVKQLYGHQEGAVAGYNPAKPGRPCHAYHCFWVARLRFCLGVKVRPGNENASMYGLDHVLDWLKKHPEEQHPTLIRGDVGYGTETWMVALEAVFKRYLFKLRQTPKVKELIRYVEIQGQWESSTQNWECCEARLRLSGWTCERRVVVYRRMHTRKSKTQEKASLTDGKQEGCLALEIIEEAAFTCEYAIYVTNLDLPMTVIGDQYRQRGDNENCYDELKNQWGWAGFNVKDLARSELMANIVALIYNWWSVFVKFVDAEVAREAITSRPLLLNHVARANTHQSQKTIRLFCAHGMIESIKIKLEEAANRLSNWMSLTAEQLKSETIWARIIAHILRNHQTIGMRATSPPLLSG